MYGVWFIKFSPSCPFPNEDLDDIPKELKSKLKVKTMHTTKNKKLRLLKNYGGNIKTIEACQR